MKNIHLSALADEAEEMPVANRLRAVTNSPQREYAARAGAVEALPDSVAALILCKVGRALVQRGQIKVTVDGEEMFFTSRDSIVIAAKNGTDEKQLWALNRRAPDVLHLLTNDGAYIESLPRKGVAQWFSNDAASKEAMATAKAHMHRDMDRLRELHQPDSEAAARDGAENAALVARLVQTFPAGGMTKDEGRMTKTEAGGFERAEQFVAAEARIDEQRAVRTASRKVDVVADTLSRPIRQVEDAADAWA